MSSNVVALSPDRKWIAFAGPFRPNEAVVEAERATGLPATSLCAVSVDGQRFVRLTASILGISGPGLFYETKVTDLSWHPSQKEIWFTLTRTPWSLQREEDARIAKVVLSERVVEYPHVGARFAAKLTTVLAEVDHPRWV